MNYKKEREQRFKKICSHFENEMLSTLLCCSKIESKLFEKLSSAVSSYLNESKNIDCRIRHQMECWFPKVKSKINLMMLS